MVHSKPLIIHKEQTGSANAPPDHHVLPTKKPTGLASYFSWDLSPGNKRFSLNSARKSDLKPQNQDDVTQQNRSLTGFRNPWPSFHKPTTKEAWESLAWGQDEDTSIQLAASHSDITGDTPIIRAQQAAQLLRVEKPDFSFDPAQRAKSTWLGHAGMLLQLAPLSNASQDPVRIVLDPIFSQRCSPSQAIGPTRWYPPPCKIEDLPPIDIMVISHNHYDHLDFDTIKDIWRLHHDRIRFVVPLNMKRWFVEMAGIGIPNSAVTELDWWESVSVTTEAGADKRLRISCCPAQHSSVRGGVDENTVLWAGWYFEHDYDGSPYRVFFAGDTGFQFHSSPKWPPIPPKPSHASVSSLTPSHNKECPADEINAREDERFPICPAFAEIAERYGSPDLLFLPIALGATYAYFRSFFSAIPDNMDPFPRHSSGLTGSVHMPPWDAVRVLKIMTGQKNANGTKPIAIAIHWGTFTSDPIEVLKTLGQLEWACSQHHIDFGRGTQDIRDSANGVFLAINQGESVVT